MAKDKSIAVVVGMYDSVDSAQADLEGLEVLHRDELIGTFDAAVIQKRNGKLHVVKRMDRPTVRIIPEELGFGQLSHKELKQSADELAEGQYALVVIGEVTVEKAFDTVVTKAASVAKHFIDATADELIQAMKEAAEGSASSAGAGSATSPKS